MQDTIQDKIKQVNFLLSEIEDLYEDQVNPEPPLVMLTSMDGDSKEAGDLMVDVYAKDSEDESLLNLSLISLIEGRLALYGIDPNAEMQVKGPEDLYDFRLNLLNVMLYNTYRLWESKFKDMPYEEMKDHIFPQDLAK